MPRNNKRKSREGSATPKSAKKANKSRTEEEIDSGKNRTEKGLDLDKDKSVNRRRNPSRAKKKLFEDTNNNATACKVVNQVSTNKSLKESIDGVAKSTCKKSETVTTPKIVETSKSLKQITDEVMAKVKQTTTVKPSEVLTITDVDRLDTTAEFENEGIRISVNAEEDEFRSDSDSESGEDDEANTNDEADSQTDSQGSQRQSFWESIKNEPEAMGFISQLIEDKLKSHKVAEVKPTGNTPNIVKSPSADTIYRPAVSKNFNRTVVTADGDFGKTNRIDSNHLNQILANIRAESTRRPVASTEPQPGTSRQADDNGFRRRETGARSPRQQQPNQVSRAKTEAERIILDAERFKAAIAPPQGNLTMNMNMTTQQLQRILDTDDDFFHVSSHVESGTVVKIERGGYVELEKLKPRTNEVDTENRMELVNRNGMSFWVTARDKEGKISNVKKWDEVFRIYSTIYTRANPERAAEILQYVDTIHVAAAAYAWENVYKYDKKFRLLMAAKPYRSWAKTYTHMWNLCLTEPINRNYNNFGGSSANHYNGRKNDRQKTAVCWKFNKNKCTRTNCNYEHKCSYCGATSHPAVNCNKKQKRGVRNESSHGDA